MKAPTLDKFQSSIADALWDFGCRHLVYREQCDQIARELTLPIRLMVMAARLDAHQRACMRCRAYNGFERVVYINRCKRGEEIKAEYEAEKAEVEKIKQSST